MAVALQTQSSLPTASTSVQFTNILTSETDDVNEATDWYYVRGGLVFTTAGERNNYDSQLQVLFHGEQVSKYMYVCMCVCMCVCMYVCMCVCVCVCVYVSVFVYVCMCV